MVATAPVDVSEHYATKSELVEIKAVLPHLATKADLAAFQVATREDIAALQVSTKADLAAFQAATQEDMAALRSDMTALESNIQTSIKTGIAGCQVGYGACPPEYYPDPRWRDDGGIRGSDGGLDRGHIRYRRVAAGTSLIHSCADTHYAGEAVPAVRGPVPRA